jgi:tripartite-type tricarboxylate transporter receptor subunit TctC
MPHLVGKQILRTLVVPFAALAVSSAGAADASYPGKPIHIVVPYPAGGATDQLARAIEKSMSETLGQPIVIENKSGAGGSIGMDAVARSAPDGYTLAFGNSGPNSIVGQIRKVPYDTLKDFRMISMVAQVPMVLALPASSPISSVKEMIAAAKKKDMNYGSVGNGSISNLTGEYFKDLAGIKLLHIPYSGGAPLMQAFGGGQLDSAFVTGLDGASMVRAGKLKYIAVATSKPTDVLPGLPTVAADVPGFESIAWFGLLAPKGVPDDVIAKLNAAVVKAVATPEVRKFFADRNVEASSSTPEEMERITRDEMKKWGEVIRKNDIKE